jgi:hypothetical protein
VACERNKRGVPLTSTPIESKLQRSPELAARNRCLKGPRTRRAGALMTPTPIESNLQR